MLTNYALFTREHAEPAEARAAHEAAALRAPHPITLSNLAELLIDHGELPSALDLFERALGMVEVGDALSFELGRPGIGLGDVVEEVEGGDEHRPALGHPVQQIRPLVEVEAVLDGVDAGPDREFRPGQSLAMRGGPIGLAMGLVHERAHLVGRHLARVRVLQLHRAGAGAHDLDEVRPGPDLLADGAPDVVGPVGLAVHAREKPPTGRGRGHDSAAEEHPGRGERPVARGLAGVEQDVAVGADVADRRDAVAQQVAERPGHEVAENPVAERLGALGGPREVPRVLEHRDMDVGIDQARQHRQAGDIDQAGVIRSAVIRAGDRLDPAVPDVDRARFRGSPPTIVHDMASDERRPSGRGRRIGEERRQATDVHCGMLRPAPPISYAAGAITF